MKVLILVAAAFLAILAVRLLALGGWINFAGAIFVSVICWQLCSAAKRLG